jgi:hypothetical protein
MQCIVKIVKTFDIITFLTICGNYLEDFSLSNI